MSESLTQGQEDVIALVRQYIGSSLKVRSDELCAFIGRGIDDGRSLLGEHISSCGLFALAVWHSVGVPHSLMLKPYVTGTAISRVVQVAHDLKAIRRGVPVAGALMHYHSRRPSFDDHVEFCLTTPDSRRCANHAGGGRALCGVGSGGGTILWNGGRPLQAWYDPRVLLGEEIL